MKTVPAMPYFSIVIPTFNRAELLAESLESVFNQTFTDYEVIVVDDGSTDHTSHVLMRHGNRIQTVKQPNSGPGAARNKGIKAARGEYIAFLDSDDLWFPWTLQSYAEAILNHNRPAILLGACCRFNHQNLNWPSKRREPLKCRTYRDFMAAGSEAVFFGTNYAVIRRTAFTSGILFDENIRVFEDQDLGLRLGLEPECLVLESPITVAYRDTPDSLTTHTGRVMQGIQFLITGERLGRYPGGSKRAFDRVRYICYSVRSVTLDSKNHSRLLDLFGIYYQCLGWHFRLLRFKYIIGFPIVLFCRWLKSVFIR